MLLITSVPLQAASFGAVLCLVTWFTSFFLGGKRTANVFPTGPKGWPIVGNIFLMLKVLAHPEKELPKLASKFGGLCMLWLASQPALIISEPEHAKELLDKKGSVFSDRPPLNEFKQRLWPGNLFLMSQGEKFRLLKRLFHDFLGAKQAVTLRKYQDYESKIMLRDLTVLPDEFVDHTRRYSMSSIFSAVYGVKLSQINHPILQNLFVVWEEMAYYTQPGTLPIDYFPFLQRLPESLQYWLKLADTLRTRESAIHRGFLRALKKQIAAGIEPLCFGASLIKIQEQEGIDDENAIGIMGSLILAGSDTTSNVLQYVVKIIAMNPDVVRAAQEELDRVVGFQRLPTWEDEPNLPYIRAFIKEVHRWAPIFDLGAVHVSSQAETYNGYTIPKGTLVFPNITSLHRNLERYGDPDVFRPERFLGDNRSSNASAKHPDFLKRDHVHFGFGRRLCPGIFVAEASLFISISRLLWAFDINPQPGEPPLKMDDKFEGLLSRPRPFKVRILPRSDAARKVIEESVAMAQTDVIDFDAVEVLNE